MKFILFFSCNICYALQSNPWGLMSFYTVNYNVNNNDVILTAINCCIKYKTHFTNCFDNQVSIC